MKQPDLKVKISILLNNLSRDYLKVTHLSHHDKKMIFAKIEKNIEANRNKLRELIIKEIKFTQKDAEEEINRACKTFALAKKYADFDPKNQSIRKGKKIIEKRISRGPLLAITPFSSPLSSPSHKIVMGILSGTSILFKPSHFAKHTGKILYEIISSVTKGKYIYLLDENNQKILNTIVSDERIGIVSFTGGYETGKKLIQVGGVKKYHMELSGGNSPIIFTPEYSIYDEQLVEKIMSGIVVKNGQRCVSVKHIFIPLKYDPFINTIQNKMLSLKKRLQKDLDLGKQTILGPLISSAYAQRTELKIHEVLRYMQDYTSLIEVERQKDYLFPTMYAFHKIDKIKIRKILEYDLPGPAVFVHFYKNKIEFNQILEAVKKDYIQSGLQLSIFTKNIHEIQNISENLVWGGIIVNDIPSFRDEFLSFGGFGRSGLGKEGFFETFFAFTDPQVFVY